MHSGCQPRSLAPLTRIPSPRIAPTPTSHLMPDEAQAVKDVVDQGAHVFFQQVPSQPVVEWDDVKGRF